MYNRIKLTPNKKKIDRIAVKPKSADNYVARPNNYSFFNVWKLNNDGNLYIGSA